MANIEQYTGQAKPTSWQDVLLAGVSGIVDSQLAKNYALSDPAYNTAGGRAGQGQLTQGTVLNVGNPIIWVIVLGVVGYLLLRK